LLVATIISADTFVGHCLIISSIKFSSKHFDNGFKMLSCNQLKYQHICWSQSANFINQNYTERFVNGFIESADIFVGYCWIISSIKFSSKNFDNGFKMLSCKQWKCQHICWSMSRHFINKISSKYLMKPHKCHHAVIQKGSHVCWSLSDYFSTKFSSKGFSNSP